MNFLSLVLEQYLDKSDFDGWFHFLFIGIALVAGILLCVFFRNCSDKTYRRILKIGWLIVVLFELYKQFFWLMIKHGEYDFSNIPYQFCSLIFYVYPCVIFGKEGKTRDILSVFSGTFIFTAGLILYGYSIYQGYLIMCIHTMVHHGMQIVMGMFIVSHEIKNFTYKNFLKCSALFLLFVGIAVLLNELFTADVEKYIPYLADGQFSLFYLSSQTPTWIPILDTIQAQSYILFFLIYVFGFILVAFLVFLASKGIYKLSSTIYKKVKKC